MALILNILLNAILIFGLFGFPQMGIAGAAFATTISRGIEVILTIFENLKTSVVRVRLKYFCSGVLRLKKDYYRYTMPVLANELVWGCGFTMFSVIMGHLGSDAVTMWGILIPLGAFAAFVLRLPILAVYFLLNLDELIKLLAVYRHYKQYKWVKNLTTNK